MTKSTLDELPEGRPANRPVEETQISFKVAASSAILLVRAYHVRQRGVIWLWDKAALDHSAAVAIWGGNISAGGAASSAIASVCM